MLQRDCDGENAPRGSVHALGDEHDMGLQARYPDSGEHAVQPDSSESGLMSSSSHRFRQAARLVRDAVDAAGECGRAVTRPMSRRDQELADDGAVTTVPSERLLDSPRIVLDGVFFQLYNTGIARLWKALMAEWSESGFDRAIVISDSGLAFGPASRDDSESTEVGSHLKETTVETRPPHARMSGKGKETVLQVSPRDVGGGAEKVALDLHRQYRKRGLDSWLVVAKRVSSEPGVIEMPADTSRSKWTRALLGYADAVSLESPRPTGARWLADRALRAAADPLHMLRIQRGLEDFDFPMTALIPRLIPDRPDILHLHNMHGAYFDVRVLPDLSARFPTIVTMHDVWLLTGHCAYPMECTGWLAGCEQCPHLDLPIAIRRDAAAENMSIKRRALSGGRIRVATPSRWLMDLLERSGLRDGLAETRVIPNGVDTTVFHPGDSAAARAALNLPTDSLVLLFTAQSAASSPFKGFEILERALSRIAGQLDRRDVLMVALGQDAPDTAVERVPVRFVPFVQDPAVVAEYYRAADLYVHPARAESFGLAVLEAMACGTPVIAADVGGLPEIVTDGESGLLFRNGDPESLASAVLRALTHDGLRTKLSVAGASKVAAEFTLKRQVDAYLQWYEEILER